MSVNIEEIVKKIITDMIENEEIKINTDDGGQLFLEVGNDYGYDDDEIEENEDEDEDEEDEEGSEED